MLAGLGWGFVAFGCAGLLTVSVGYPLLARLWGTLRRPRHDSAPSTETPAQTPHGLVSLIVAMRNAEALLPDKIACLEALREPAGGLEVLLASDGSTDRTVEIAREACSKNAGWTLIELTAHGGKHCALDAAAQQAQGEILVFTDVDALLEKDALMALLEPFADPAVGGVCGQRRLGEATQFHGDSQSRYVAIDSGIKAIEARFGSITSNDGKLYAIRAALYESIPGGVTDDLFANMSVVRQGGRFVFAPGARAWIRVPSRNPGHELSRRRRIVCRSLRGIWLQRAVLNPFRTGLYAFGLGINKVGRRLLPFFLLAVFVGTGMLAVHSPIARWVWLAQILGLVLIALEPVLRPVLAKGPLIQNLGKLLKLSNYAFVGFLGTFLGVLDFVLARQVVRWDPVKSD